jgi:hypothetical protein
MPLRDGNLAVTKQNGYHPDRYPGDEQPLSEGVPELVRMPVNSGSFEYLPENLAPVLRGVLDITLAGPERLIFIQRQDRLGNVIGNRATHPRSGLGGW